MVVHMYPPPTASQLHALPDLTEQSTAIRSPRPRANFYVALSDRLQQFVASCRPPSRPGAAAQRSLPPHTARERSSQPPNQRDHDVMPAPTCVRPPVHIL
ncbi:hypothetical protein T492DRAFT_974655 [Pavlovales sp. CCMP2436]|nr:hypothetical protein T492DRAFT_974655 [Pavlovales sp. CCMP2436]